MKSTKQLSKRIFSPGAAKNSKSTEKKDKAPVFQHVNPYQINKIQKQSKNQINQIYSDKKRSSNYLRQLLKQDSANKYRIVTQPIEQRAVHSIVASFGKSKNKNQSQIIKNRVLSTKNESCSNCQKYLEQLNSIKNQINNLIILKGQWKSGECTLNEIGQKWGIKKSKNNIRDNSLNQIKQIKKHIFDLMQDIQTLSQIDYPKMLSLKIFKYEAAAEPPPSADQNQIHSLLSQLRNHYEGKIIKEDLQDFTQESTYVKSILRNLKIRLGRSLRVILQLKIQKKILQKSQQMTQDSEQYIRHLIEQVLKGYRQAM